jgi:hypothetical protein
MNSMIRPAGSALCDRQHDTAFWPKQTLEEAERVMSQIGAAYFAPNKDLRLFADIAREGEKDPLFAFSNACREELQFKRA